MNVRSYLKNTNPINQQQKFKKEKKIPPIIAELFNWDNICLLTHASNTFFSISIVGCRKTGILIKHIEFIIFYCQYPGRKL